MAWGGTATWQIFKDYFILILPDFDADAENSGYIDLREHLGYRPSHYSGYAVRTAGLTDVIDVRLQGFDGSGTSAFQYFKIENSTGAEHIQSSYANYGAAYDLSGKLHFHIRIDVTTVGAGNTLTVTIIGRR